MNRGGLLFPILQASAYILTYFRHRQLQTRVIDVYSRQFQVFLLKSNPFFQIDYVVFVYLRSNSRTNHRFNRRPLLKSHGIITLSILHTAKKQCTIPENIQQLVNKGCFIIHFQRKVQGYPPLEAVSIFNNFPSLSPHFLTNHRLGH